MTEDVYTIVSNANLEQGTCEQVYKLLSSDKPIFRAKRKITANSIDFFTIGEYGDPVYLYHANQGHTPKKELSFAELMKIDDILADIVCEIGETIRKKKQGISLLAYMVNYLSDKIDDLGNIINLSREQRIELAKNLISQVLNAVSFEIKIKGIPIPWVIIKTISMHIVSGFIDSFIYRKNGH